MVTSLTSSIKTSYHFLYRNVFSIKSQTKLVCACTGMATFASITAMTAADDGILPSTEPSAQFRMRLMAWSIWYMGMAPKRTCSALTILKECVRTSPRALSAWDSGSVIVLVTDLLTRTRVGTQCPGSMWKKYHPRRLKFRWETTIKFQVRFWSRLGRDTMKLGKIK